MRWRKTYTLVVMSAIAFPGLSGCLGLETNECHVDEVGYTHVGASSHPNEKGPLVDRHVQTGHGEDPGIELHAGPTCAYPFTEQWHTARFDEDGRFDEREGLHLPAVGPYQAWGTMIKNGEVLAGGDPAEDALVVQVYLQDLYPFPDVTNPISVEVPIICCHVYDTQVFVHNANALDDVVYQVEIRSKGTGEIFHTGPPPATIDGAELTERLGSRYEDTMLIELTSPQAVSPPPTPEYFFVVQVNVPDETWPGSAPEPAQPTTAPP